MTKSEQNIDESTYPPGDRRNSIFHFTLLDKFPIIVTICFFAVISYVTFYHHHYWINPDGIFYLRAGEQVLYSDSWNVDVPNAPIGGPILYAIFNSVVHDGFLTLKIISLLSGTGIVLSSYYIIRNVSNPKVALFGQSLFACYAGLASRSVLSTNELLPILLILISLYFITKKQLKLSDMMIVGFLLGGSSMIRYQAIPVFISLLIFLLVRNKNLRHNLLQCLILCISFLIAFSPLIVFNYSVHHTLIDTNSNLYLLTNSEIQTSDWHHKMMDLVGSEEKQSGIFVNFNLFLKNYFYNLFYHNPNLLFNFNGHNAISIIPVIPFLGLIPVLGGFIHIIKPDFNKMRVAILVGIFVITAILIYLTGNLYIHFFAVMIIPIIVLFILNFKNIQKNLLPLVILPIVFFPTISTVALYRGDQLLPIWISVISLSAIFFTDTVPRIFSKLTSYLRQDWSRHLRIFTVSVIVLILVANIAFSYKSLEIYLFGDTFTGVKDEFSKLIYGNKHLEELGVENKLIGEILSRQPGIENSYVMSKNNAYSYYAHSKSIYSTFQEGVKNDTLENFITRKNWSSYDIYFSNINSFPMDRYNVYKPIPDYLIYEAPKTYEINQWNENKTQTNDLRILTSKESSYSTQLSIDLSI